MNDALRDRISRRLEGLSDERGYQILDYIEFLDSKYGNRAASGFFTRLTETAEDTMRAVGLPIRAVSGTMGIVESAGKVMKGVAAAAKAVVDEAVDAATPPKPSTTPSPPEEGAKPGLIIGGPGPNLGDVDPDGPRPHIR